MQIDRSQRSPAFLKQDSNGMLSDSVDAVIKLTSLAAIMS